MKNKKPLKKLKKAHSTTIYFFARSLFINGLLLLIPLLLIGIYSIARISSENSHEAQKNAASILNQADSLLNTFYTHVDNAYLFFSSNPKVSLQLQRAFKEDSLSLDSIRSAESISLSFQNLLYTNDDLLSIYIYYKNDHNRIFAPLNAKILSFSNENEARILDFYEHLKKEEVWMKFSEKPFLSFESTAPSLLISRNLYQRGTGIQNGIVMYRFHAGKLQHKLQNLLSYHGQELFLIDSHTNTVWPSSEIFSDETLLNFYSQLNQKDSLSESHTEITNDKFSNYQVSLLAAPKSYGFSFLLVTPLREIYRSSRNLVGAYVLVFCLATVAAFLIAYFKTKHDYRYLNQIISVFSDPNAATTITSSSNKSASSPFEFILMNVIHLFIEQDYLKIQASEKDARLQLWKMEALQHQINPHFLHNTLNSIYWEAVKLTGSENMCSQLISNLSAITRYSLSDPQEDVLVKNELDYLKKYLEIMQLRYPDKFDVDFSISPDCEYAYIKKMLLQPLVENSIYHGLRQHNEKGLIRISAYKEQNERILFNIYDTGDGMDEQTLNRISNNLKEYDGNTQQHIGLANTNARLILAYGEESAIHIISKAGKFTSVQFSIPFTNN